MPTHKISEVLPQLETSLDIPRSTKMPICVRGKIPIAIETPVSAAKKAFFSMKDQRPNLQSMTISANRSIAPPSPSQQANRQTEPRRHFSTINATKTINIYKRPVIEPKYKQVIQHFGNRPGSQTSRPETGAGTSSAMKIGETLISDPSAVQIHTHAPTIATKSNRTQREEL